MNNLVANIKPYSKAIVRLLKTTVEKNSSVWESIIFYEDEIQKYVSQIGLELIVKREEGFAYLRQFEDEEGNTLGLVSRRQVGFETSIVLVVLRQSLEEFDNSPTQVQATEKFITDAEIREEVELFLPEKYNRVKFMKEIGNYISNAEKLGYLKEISKKENITKYQIQRIIKEKVTLDILQDFKTKLEEYVKPV